MKKSCSIIASVACIASIFIIATADEEQRHFLKTSRGKKPQTPTREKRGNPVKLDPAAAAAFAYWTPERISSAVLLKYRGICTYMRYG